MPAKPLGIPDGINSSKRSTGPCSPLCRKRPFTTHADRLRPRLEDRRLPVAGPAVRRPAGPRASTTRPTSTTTSPPAYATPGRDSTAACAPCGKGDVLVVWKLDRRGRNLAHVVNTVHDLSARRGVGLRVLAGQGAQIDTTTAARSPRVRHLRGAGRVPAGADPRTHCGRAQGRTGPRTQGRQQVRSVESPRRGWLRPRWPTATRRCLNCAANSASGR